MSEQDFTENRDKELLVDDKMRIIDAFSPREKELAMKDYKWRKKNITKGRVFMQQVPDSDVPNTEDWENAKYKEYMKIHSDFNKQDFNKFLNK